MMSCELKTSRPRIRYPHVPPTGDIIITTDLEGHFKGDNKSIPCHFMVLLNFPLSTYLKTSSAMLMAEYTEFNDEIADVGKEVANIMVTNTKKDLKAFDYEMTVKGPTMYRESQVQLTYPKDTLIVTIPITCDLGEFYVEFAYQENKNT